jgi:hypothetical protein
MSVLTVDISRTVGFGFVGLLICYTYLMKAGYGNNLFVRLLVGANILVPSIYVGSNNGFCPVPGLYQWLYQLCGLQGILGGL